MAKERGKLALEVMDTPVLSPRLFRAPQLVRQALGSDSLRPTRILFLQSTSEIGGSDIALLRLIDGLDRIRFEPCVLLPEEGALALHLRRRGCRIFIVPRMLKLTTRRGTSYLLRYLLNYPVAVAVIARLINREAIDVVHTNSLHNLYGFMAALLARRPHVWHAREVVTQSRILRAVEAVIAPRFSARVLATSDAVGAMFGAAPRVSKLPDSLNLDTFHPANCGLRVRRELDLPDDAPVVGVVARLDEVKGIDVFLRAAARCRALAPDARFIVVGGPIVDQEERAADLQRLASSLGLDRFVRFTGWRYGPDDMPSVYAALDILVVASRQPEGFCLAALEAMASGKPVVATRHGAAPELCVDGETALLVCAEDPDGMADAMLTLLRDRAHARALGAAGRRRAEALCGQDAGRRIELVYEEIVG